MKLLYWNIRGIVNSPSRLALKRLITKNKSDFVFIDEPWMNYDDFPSTWLNRLGLKVFSFNHREDNLPNLWCICSILFELVIINKDDQQVSFKIKVGNNDFFISAIYASNSFLKRKQLWNTLQNNQTQIDAPWCFLGDFNTIIGAHEHYGALNPARPPIIDFQNWTDSNDLLHIHTRGATYTWDNGRSGRRHVKRRLDRVVCNQNFLDPCSSVACNTLIKLRSDHYPLQFEFKTDENSFTSSFKFLNMWTQHKDCKAVIDEC